jgi:hypothetical protein
MAIDGAHEDPADVEAEPGADLADEAFGSSWPSPLAIAAVASIGAGGIHAAIAGAHGQERLLATLFVWAAAVQVVWGIVTLLQPRPLVTAAGMTANFGVAAAWLFTRLRGVSWITGLEVREKVQYADAAAAGLAIVAAGIAFGILLTPGASSEHRLTNLAIPAFVVAALTLPAMITVGNHEHGVTTVGHDHGAAPAVTTDTLTDTAHAAARLSARPSSPPRPRP